MKIVKQILSYVVWFLLALLIGIVYILLIIRFFDVSLDGFWHIFKVFFYLGVILVGLLVGSVIGLIYVLTDVFYLKKKLKNSPKATAIRFIVLLAITVFVGIIHYILEKVIDVI